MGADLLAWVDGTAVLICAPGGIPVDTEGVAVELLGEAIARRAQLVVVPTERLTDDFFDPATGVAARLAGRFVTYRLQLVVVGDLRRCAPSTPTATPTPCGPWFCGTFDEFRVRLDVQQRAPRVTDHAPVM